MRARPLIMRGNGPRISPKPARSSVRPSTTKPRCDPWRICQYRTIADWCAVDIVADGGALQRIAVAHVDPTKVEFARMLQERYPADPKAPGGVHEVIRTGKAAFMSRIPAALLEAAAQDDEQRRIIRELNFTSYMCVR
jgi:hypothetical protein